MNVKFRNGFSAIMNGDIAIAWFWFLPVCMLLFVNWAMEVLKWKVLIREFAKPSFYLAFKAILTGVFVSFFTPNRTGEFAGRIIYLKDKKVEASLLTIAGSFAQNICTLLFGCLAALFFFASEYLEWIIGGGIYLFTVITTLFLFFNIDRIVVLFRLFGLPRKWLKYFIPIRHLTLQQLSLVLWYSVIRYAVFCLQFIFMFMALGIPMGIAMAMQGIGLLFLIQSIIPTIAFLELGSRGIAAHYAFQVSPEYGAAILFASYSIWLINLFLPGMIGSILFLFNHKKDVDL